MGKHKSGNLPYCNAMTSSSKYTKQCSRRSCTESGELNLCTTHNTMIKEGKSVVRCTPEVPAPGSSDPNPKGQASQVVELRSEIPANKLTVGDPKTNSTKLAYEGQILLNKESRNLLPQASLLQRKHNLLPKFDRDTTTMRSYGLILIQDAIREKGLGEVIRCGTDGNASSYLKYRHTDASDFMDIFVKITSYVEAKGEKGSIVIQRGNLMSKNHNTLYIIICVPWNELWIVTGEEVERARLSTDDKFRINDTSRPIWQKFHADWDGCADIVDAYYLRLKQKGSTHVPSAPIPVYRNRLDEDFYKGVSKLGRLAFLRWKNPDPDSCSCNFLVEGLPLINRKAVLVDGSDDWSVDISRNGKENYRVDTFALLSVDLPKPKNNKFLLIPAIVLQDAGYLSTDSSPGKFTLKYSDNPELFDRYLFDYDSPTLRHDTTTMIANLKRFDPAKGKWVANFRITEPSNRLILGSRIKSIDELYAAEQLEHKYKIPPKFSASKKNMRNNMMERLASIMILESLKRSNTGEAGIINDNCQGDIKFRDGVDGAFIRMQVKSAWHFSSGTRVDKCTFQSVKGYEGCGMLFIALEPFIIWGMTYKELQDIRKKKRTGNQASFTVFSSVESREEYRQYELRSDDDVSKFFRRCYSLIPTKEIDGLTDQAINTPINAMHRIEHEYRNIRIAELSSFITFERAPFENWTADILMNSATVQERTLHLNDRCYSSYGCPLNHTRKNIPYDSTDVEFFAFNLPDPYKEYFYFIPYLELANREYLSHNGIKGRTSITLDPTDTKHWSYKFLFWYKDPLLKYKLPALIESVIEIREELYILGFQDPEAEEDEPEEEDEELIVSKPGKESDKPHRQDEEEEEEV